MPSETEGSRASTTVAACQGHKEGPWHGRGWRVDLTLSDSGRAEGGPQLGVQAGAGIAAVVDGQMRDWRWHVRSHPRDEGIEPRELAEVAAQLPSLEPAS